MVESYSPENGVQSRVGKSSKDHETQSQNGLSKEDARARDEAMLIKQLALQELHGSTAARQKLQDELANDSANPQYFKRIIAAMQRTPADLKAEKDAYLSGQIDDFIGKLGPRNDANSGLPWAQLTETNGKIELIFSAMSDDDRTNAHSENQLVARHTLTDTQPTLHSLLKPMEDPRRDVEEDQKNINSQLLMNDSASHLFSPRIAAILKNMQSDSKDRHQLPPQQMQILNQIERAFLVDDSGAIDAIVKNLSKEDLTSMNKVAAALNREIGHDIKCSWKENVGSAGTLTFDYGGTKVTFSTQPGAQPIATEVQTELQDNGQEHTSIVSVAPNTAVSDLANSLFAS